MNRKTQEWGSDLIRTRISRQEYVFQKRSWQDLKMTEWAFVLFGILSTVTSIGFSTYHLITSIIDNDRQYIFPVLTILNNVISIYFLWRGVMNELAFNLLIQLVVKIVVWIFDLIFFLLAFKNKVEEDEQTLIRDIRFYSSSALLCACLITGGIVIYGYWTSNIAIFRTVGTEPKFVRLCRKWSFCENMILLDAVVYITVIFHMCNFPYFVNNASVYYLAPLWILATIVYVILGNKAVKSESRPLTYIFYVLSHCQPIFVVFLITEAILTKSELPHLLFVSLLVSSVLALLVRVGLLISVVMMQNSYGLGLKQAAAREEERKQLMASRTIVYEDTGVMASNMTRLPATETEL